MNERIFNVLFLCTANSARSILAESLLNHLGKSRFHAYSTGSQPSGTINPWVLELLAEQGMPVAGLRSKGWNEFAAGEVCPVWPGQPLTTHWGIADPAAAEGDDEARRAAVSQAYRLLSRRLSLFLSLPLDKLDALSLQRQLSDIGRLDH